VSSVAFHLLRPVRLQRPFWHYLEALAKEPYPFLLDSAATWHRLGRYSYIGADPFLTLRAKRIPGKTPAVAQAQIEIRGRTKGPVMLGAGAPFAELRALLREYYIPPAAYVSRPAPFLSGAVGYLGYEACYYLENLPDLGRDDLQLPDICFGLYDAVLVCDHGKGETFLSVVGRGTSARSARATAEEQADQLLRKLKAFERDAEPDPAPQHDSPIVLPSECVDAATYAALVERARQHILAGDAFEICVTHRVEAECDVPPFHLYRELRRCTPAPFGAYLALPEATIVSASPERFLKLGADRIAESRPIKGTRPRGSTPEDDRRLKAELFHSIKDQAENNMIVDLVRNDLGRVCEAGSVTVPELRVIEPHPTVFQMVSTVRGSLRDDRDAIDLICACFPGGSMTGAPKIEAMKIIDTLEPVKRGVYSGAIGFLDFSGPIDLNIVIRTIVLSNGRATFGVGGAVVADSDPLGEYQETMDKARALLRALSNSTYKGLTDANAYH
jgi:para-aminobenzoate synthetase component 1